MPIFVVNSGFVPKAFSKELMGTDLPDEEERAQG
jgi:hypothetical protein